MHGNFDQSIVNHQWQYLIESIEVVLQLQLNFGWISLLLFFKSLVNVKIQVVIFVYISL